MAERRHATPAEMRRLEARVPDERHQESPWEAQWKVGHLKRPPLDRRDAQGLERPISKTINKSPCSNHVMGSRSKAVTNGAISGGAIRCTGKCDLTGPSDG